jgi:hypothetical protein
MLLNIHILNSRKTQKTGIKKRTSHGVPKPPRIVTLRQLPPPLMRLEGFPATADPWLL